MNIGKLIIGSLLALVVSHGFVSVAKLLPGGWWSLVVSSMGLLLAIVGLVLALVAAWRLW